MRAVQQRAEDRKKRMKEAAKYVVDDSETDEKGAFALQLAEHNTLGPQAERSRSSRRKLRTSQRRAAAAAGCAVA